MAYKDATHARLIYAPGLAHKQVWLMMHHSVSAATSGTTSSLLTEPADRESWAAFAALFRRRADDLVGGFAARLASSVDSRTLLIFCDSGFIGHPRLRLLSAFVSLVVAWTGVGSRIFVFSGSASSFLFNARLSGQLFSSDPLSSSWDRVFKTMSFSWWRGHILVRLSLFRLSRWPSMAQCPRLVCPCDSF